MALEVIENYIDPSGRRVVRVQRDNGECYFFRFDAGMTVPEMKAQAQDAFDREVQAIQAMKQEQARIEAITNGITSYQSGQLNATQQRNLLDALCKEWRG